MVTRRKFVGRPCRRSRKEGICAAAFCTVSCPPPYPFPPTFFAVPLLLLRVSLQFLFFFLQVSFPPPPPPSLTGTGRSDKAIFSSSYSSSFCLSSFLPPPQTLICTGHMGCFSASSCVCPFRDEGKTRRQRRKKRRRKRRGRRRRRKRLPKVIESAVCVCVKSSHAGEPGSTRLSSKFHGFHSINYIKKLLYTCKMFHKKIDMLFFPCVRRHETNWAKLSCHYCTRSVGK